MLHVVRVVWLRSEIVARIDEFPVDMDNALYIRSFHVERIYSDNSWSRIASHFCDMA
jgi:hypothetical protein